MSMALLDLYLARRRVRASFPMKGFNRVSDLLNNAQAEFLTGTVQLTAGRAAARPSEMSAASELAVRRSDIRIVRPVEEPVSGPADLGQHRPRLRINVVCEIGEWQVTGILHLMDRIAWVDFLSAMRDRFLPFTNAKVRSGEDGTGTDYEFVLVNAARISALYEQPQQ